MDKVTAGLVYSENYDINDLKANGDKPQCVVCAKNINEKTAKWVELIDFGVTVMLEGVEPMEHDGGTSIGCFPVGPDCYRKLVKASKEE